MRGRRKGCGERGPAIARHAATARRRRRRPRRARASPLAWASIRRREVGIPAHPPCWGLAASPDYTVPATPPPSNLTRANIPRGPECDTIPLMRRIARFPSNTVTSLLLLATLSCRDAQTTRLPTPSPSPPATARPATRPAATPPSPPPSPPPGLIEQLDQPPDRSAGRGERLLERLNDVRAHAKASAERRDAHFAELTRLAARPDAGVVLLVVEAIKGGGGSFGNYDRVGLFRPTGGDRDPAAGTATATAAALERLGLIRVDDPERWRQLSLWAGRLLESDAPVDVDKPIFDIDEAAIVSRFDGGRWTSRSWFYLLTRAELFGADPRRPEDLPPETRAAVNLFQLADRSLGDDRPPPFARFWAPFVEQFGEFPARPPSAAPAR
jgi:hypothetical protein